MRFAQLHSESMRGFRGGLEMARELFPAIVESNGFHLWSPSISFITLGIRLLIGVAPGYSTLDMKLLDSVKEGRLRRAELNIAIDVFDVDDLKSMEKFEEYVPGIGSVYQTPVVGVWNDGLLVEKAWGKAGRDLLAKHIQASMPSA